MVKKTIIVIGQNTIAMNGDIEPFLKGFKEIKVEDRASAKFIYLQCPMETLEKESTQNNHKEPTELSDVIAKPEECSKDELVKWFKAMSTIAIGNYKDNSLMKKVMYSAIKEERKKIN